MSRQYRYSPARYELRIVVFLAVPVLAYQPVVASLFVINDWTLTTAIMPPQAGGTDLDNSTVPQNPFQATHNAFVATPGPSTAQTSYDFSWSESAGTGSFHVAGEHQAAGVSSGILSASSQGSILITPTVDLLVTMNAAYEYTLPADFMMVDLWFRVREGAFLLFNASDDYNTLFGTGSGSFEFHDQFILPAGHTWLFLYGMRIETFSNTVGFFGTGNGEINFSFAPVPEPATAALLIISALVVITRRRTRIPH